MEKTTKALAVQRGNLHDEQQLSAVGRYVIILAKSGIVRRTPNTRRIEDG